MYHKGVPLTFAHAVLNAEQTREEHCWLCIRKRVRDDVAWPI